MENRFHGLPPLKRFRLIQQEQTKAILPSCLPAKKRKENRDPSPHTNTSTTTPCLPAKKRIWAPPPPLSSFDLNLEYNPFIDDQEETQSKPLLNPISDNNLENPIADNNQEIDHTDEKDEEIEDGEDGILCAVCQSTDADPSDPIVFCDGCNLMVHTTCYGQPLTEYVPEGDWFCSQCLVSQSSEKKSFACCLCPAVGGALKPTTDGQWAHIVCALFVPEVFFHEPDGREGVDCSKVPERRWEKSCYVCDRANGCAIDCSEPKCPLAFHVTCGVQEDLSIEYQEGKNNGAIVAGFCKRHTDIWRKQQSTGKYKIVARDEHEEKK